MFLILCMSLLDNWNLFILGMGYNSCGEFLMVFILRLKRENYAYPKKFMHNAPYNVHNAHIMCIMHIIILCHVFLTCMMYIKNNFAVFVHEILK